MEFICRPDLAAHMEKKGLDTVLVELVEINNSDLDVTELHPRLVDKRLRDIYVEKKGYRAVDAGWGTVLLPKFPLQMEEQVTFGLKRILFIKCVTCEGVKV